MKIDWFQVNEKTIVTVQSPRGNTYEIKKNGRYYCIFKSTINGKRYIDRATKLEQAKTMVLIEVAKYE